MPAIDTDFAIGIHKHAMRGIMSALASGLPALTLAAGTDDETVLRQAEAGTVLNADDETAEHDIVALSAGIYMQARVTRAGKEDKRTWLLLCGADNLPAVLADRFARIPDLARAALGMDAVWQHHQWRAAQQSAARRAASHARRLADPAANG